MTLELPSFHDGHLTALRVEPKIARVELTRLTGERYELVLEGVEGFQVDDFREGNIISFQRVLSGGEPDTRILRECLRRLDPPLHEDVAPHYHAARAQRVAALTARVIAGETVLVRIEASYGADLVARCASVSLVALDAQPVSA